MAALPIRDFTHFNKWNMRMQKQASPFNPHPLTPVNRGLPPLLEERGKSDDNLY